MTDAPHPKLKVIKNEIEDPNSDPDRMPRVATQNYDEEFVIKQRFIDEVQMALYNLAYKDVSPMFNFIDNVVNKQNGVVKSGILTEFIRRLMNYPYVNVARIIALISNPQTRIELYETRTKAKNGDGGKDKPGAVSGAEDASGKDDASTDGSVKE